MKKMVIIITAVALLFSCSKDKSEDKLTRDIAFQMLVSVNWSLILLTDGEDVKTSEFSDYTFDFLPTNQVKANDGTNVIEGIWYVLDNNNPDSESGLTVHIAFESPENFVSLNNEWAIISADQQLFRLQYLDGEANDFLTLSGEI